MTHKPSPQKPQSPIPIARSSKLRLDPDAIEDLKRIGVQSHALEDLESRMTDWQVRYQQTIRMKRYGSQEYHYECAMHENCIFAFKFLWLGAHFKFRLSRGYHQSAKVKLTYSRDYSQRRGHKKRLPRPTQALVEPDQISLEKSSDEELSQLSFTNGNSQKGLRALFSNSERSSTALNEIE